MDRRQYLQALGAGGVLSLAGCLGGSAGADSGIADQTFTVATATTVEDSGLLGDLSAGFQNDFGASVRAVVRGTGAALRTARDGNCDAVLVHARPLEDEFLRAGHGVNRRTVMVNDFLVVGPPDDPADAAGSNPLDAFRAIAASDATFLSRGDRSGTHLRERRLWNETGVDSAGDWYRETGQGMGATLVAGNEAGAYMLVDRGTFLNTETSLAAHVAHGVDDPPDLLRNEYAVIPTNPARHDVAYALAMAFVGYLTGPGQDRIEAFRVDGERAFQPAARNEDPDFEQYVPSD